MTDIHDFIATIRHLLPQDAVVSPQPDGRHICIASCIRDYYVIAEASHAAVEQALIGWSDAPEVRREPSHSWGGHI